MKSFLRHPLLPPILLFLLSFALFSPSIGYFLVALDDPIFVVNNPIVFEGFSFPALARAFTTLHGDRCMYSPLLWVSFLLDNLFFRSVPLHPWGYHLTNVLLHAASAVLLFFILRFAVRRPWIAFFAAAVWALHPLRVESVAWVTERKDTLSTFFALLSILFYLNAFPPTRHSSLVTRHCRKGLLCFALLAFAAGLLSKPMLVTLPFLFLLLDYWPLRRFSLSDALRAFPRLALEKWPFFLLALLASLVTYRLQDGAISAVPLLIRLRRLPVNYLFYVSRTLWPSGLSPLFEGFPATLPWLAAAATAFLLLAATALLLFRHAPGVLVGLLAFAGLLFPVSGIVLIGDVFVADRYSYLPAFGLSLALAAFLDACWERARPARDGGAEAESPPSSRHSSLVTCLCGGTAAAATLAALALVTLRILPVWKNPDTFAQHVLKTAPNHALVFMYRFNDTFCDRADLPAAVEVADAVFAKEPTSCFAVLTQILVLSQTRSVSDALAFFDGHPPKDAPNDPNRLALELALAVLYAEAGDFDAAAAHAGKALSIPDCSPKGRENAAALAFWVHAAAGHSDRAAEFARLVPSMDPDHPLAPSNFLLPLTSIWNMGLRKQALPRLLRLAGDASSNPALLNNIAWLLATAPNSSAPPGDILAIARRAHALQPDHPVICDTLGVALAFNSRFDEAIAVESSVADFLRTSTAPEAPAMLADVQSRIALFRSRTPFTENADLKLLYAAP